jgi:ubiquinone/menaquinone biosynthesis C-methylase UbiE
VKMQRFEKWFVNGRRHSQRVAAEAERRLREADLRPSQRLLDVGCGNGAALIQAGRTLGLEAVGVDVDPDQIADARSAATGVARVRFLVADAAALPFADGEFDVVYTNKTTHHVPHWQDALAEMARVLVPGGRLLYSDFVAPFGRRLPTRRGVDAAAAAHGLEHKQRGGLPFHYHAVFEKSAA